MEVAETTAQHEEMTAAYSIMNSEKQKQLKHVKTRQTIPTCDPEQTPSCSVCVCVRERERWVYFSQATISC